MPDMPLSPWQQTEPPGELQVLWFERRVNLETSTRGLEESEREVRGREVTEGTLEGGALFLCCWVQHLVQTIVTLPLPIHLDRGFHRSGTDWVSSTGMPFVCVDSSGFDCWARLLLEGSDQHVRTPSRVASLLLLDLYTLALVLCPTQLMTPITMGACPSLQPILTESAPHRDQNQTPHQQLNPEPEPPYTPTTLKP